MKPRLVHLTRCGSTSVVAAAWARGGGPLPVVVSAETQTGGRGQWGRRWQSPAGGCWFTLALPGDAGGPARDAADRGLPLAAAAAVRGALRDTLGPLPVRVVEPNDVLLGDAKVAGLLCERIASPFGAVTLVGVGINANAAPAAADPDGGEPLRRPPPRWRLRRAG